jgi:hypothetical protein
MKRKLLILALAAVGLGIVGLAGFAAYWSWFLCAGDACPSIAQFDEYRPAQPARLYAADGRFIAEVGLERRSVVRLEQVPQHVTDAFVMTEDKRYYRHAGIDYIRVLGSVWANVKAGGMSEGFSTITMQLARNIFPEQLPSRSKARNALQNVLRKFREAKVARELETKFSKERILELYLNQIPFGSGAYGVESAAQRYFGRPINELTVAEGAMLAALPKAPSRYNPRRFPRPRHPAPQHGARAHASRGGALRRRRLHRQGVPAPPLPPGARRGGDRALLRRVGARRAREALREAGVRAGAPRDDLARPRHAGRRRARDGAAVARGGGRHLRPLSARHLRGLHGQGGGGDERRVRRQLAVPAGRLRRDRPAQRRRARPRRRGATSTTASSTA